MVYSPARVPVSDHSILGVCIKMQRDGFWEVDSDEVYEKTLDELIAVYKP